MKKGAYDYIAKPFQLVEISLVVKQALERRRLKEENAYLKTQLKEKYRFESIVGKQQADAQRSFTWLETISGTNSTVLITGETGTGKELDCESDSFQQPATRAEDRQHQLWRNSRDAAGKRIIRARERRIHRSASDAYRTVRAGAQRNHFPR